MASANVVAAAAVLKCPSVLHLLVSYATEELQQLGVGAPFCVDVVRDGCRVGVLRGHLTMTSLGSLATQDAQMRLAERVFERKRSLYRMKSNALLLSGSSPDAARCDGFRCRGCVYSQGSFGALHCTHTTASVLFSSVTFCGDGSSSGAGVGVGGDADSASTLTNPSMAAIAEHSDEDDGGDDAKPTAAVPLGTQTAVAIAAAAIG